MTLEKKAETAIINHLKANEALKDLGFSHHISDDVKDHQVVVTAERGDEVAAPSGVFEMECSISLRMRIKRWSGTPEKFDHAAEAIEQLLFIPQLHEHLSRNAESFHCYHAEMKAAEREPQESKYYSHTFNLTIEAMPQTFQVAENLYARTHQTPA